MFNSFSKGSVIVPHVEPHLAHERCESMCIPRSLGTYQTTSVELCYKLSGIRRSGRLLCEPDTNQCDDQVNITMVSSSMCRAWAHILTFLKPEGVGTQISQDNAIGSWLPCSVFCQTNTGTWYSPRRELEAYYLSATLPDGTQCSNNEDIDLFCQVSFKSPFKTNIYPS